LPSALYRIFFGFFEDHNVSLWLLKQSVRAVAGHPGYEEVLFLVDGRGSNGKGAWLAIMKAVLGIDNGYYGTLEYEKHLIGLGMSAKNVNNPGIAELAGKRFVAVNESPESCAVTLIKRLASGGDDPILATAKYKDPAVFQPQCLLAFCTNKSPDFPPKDGGFKSRCSYVNMPFEWVENPTGPGQRGIDINVKEQIARTIQSVFLFWAVHLTPGLLRPKARAIMPAPAKVQEDNADQFAAASFGSVVEHRRSWARTL
jgi:phage/plasmid-associated DNA primase